MAIDKLPSGKFRARLQRGKKRISKTFDTRKQANDWLKYQESVAFAASIGQAPPRMVLREVLVRYAEEVSPTKRGERWEVMRLRMMARDTLGDVLLAELASAHLAAWRDRRLKEVQPASVTREMNLLSAVLTRAVKEWGYLQNNPLSSVQRPRTPEPRNRRITDDEIKRLLLACGYNRETTLETVQARVGACLLFAIETAMRAGEICGLTWNRVNLAQRIAHLDKTKNGTARDVPLSKEAIRLIKQVQGVDERLVFGILAEQLDALFRKAKARAMIDDLHFHDTRREALTRLAAKVDVMTLAKISGHRDLRILQSVYYAPDMSKIAASLD